jgi:glycerophosphoryl diester phosphodiesterase
LNKYLDKSKPFIIAHRGEPFDAPENTMAAINLAWERGAEAVEIDVHLSKDNEVEVIHYQ